MVIAIFSILDALDTLCTSVPQWNDRLDNLNGQIALRQIELARLEESERPPTRSLRNKGSTESLRPKDADENPFVTPADENNESIPMNPFETPKSAQNGFSPRTTTTTTPPSPKSNPRESAPLTRKASKTSPSAAQPRSTPNVLRKRKTESLASGESVLPKYRTRSMIIVYYDSAVQTAFEELVKFVSGSRNSMRKGKMAAKMAEMKRAAELELEYGDEDDDEDDDEDNDGVGSLPPNKGSLAVAQKKTNALEVGSDDETDAPPPKLKFVSTRQMGLPKDLRPENVGGTLSVGLLRGLKRGGETDIFDILDKGLEWCQSQCEHGAHQFLRDGECGTEINNIKKKLAEVKAAAEKEMGRIRKEEESQGAKKPSTKPPRAAPQTTSRELKQPQRRRELAELAPTPKELEVDGMEVDDDEDEGVDDLQLPPKLVFKRAGQI